MMELDELKIDIESVEYRLFSFRSKKRKFLQLHLSINQKIKYLIPLPSWGKNIDWHKTYLSNNKSTMIRKKLNRLKP